MTQADDLFARQLDAYVPFLQPSGQLQQTLIISFSNHHSSVHGHHHGHIHHPAGREHNHN